MFLNRNYAIIDISSLDQSQRESLFSNMKQEGIIQTDYYSTRLNLDGSLALIKWNIQEISTISDAESLIIFEGTHSEILIYLSDNDANWNPPFPNPS